MYKQESDLREEQLGPCDYVDNAVALAERELTAFYGAVSRVFGKAVATAAAEEWIREASSSHSPLDSPEAEWRRITISISRRLAQRLAA